MSTTATPGTLDIPEAENRIPPTSTEDIDAAVETLRQNAKRWADLDIQSRIDLLDELALSIDAAAPAWGHTGAQFKELPESSLHFGEEYAVGPYQVVKNVAALKHTLEQIRDTGHPQPLDVRVRPNGQVAVDVFPVTITEKVVYKGFSGEVWIKPDYTIDDVEQGLARQYRNGGDSGGVALVLGAGNVSSIGPMDCLYKLFVHQRVCLLKMNPVNEQTGPHIAEAFAPLIREGFVRIVYGGAEQGKYLTDHDGIDEIHITGSDKTHDAIVYGPGEEGKERKRNDDRRLDKPISSELGNVTPVIVVPGPWSDKDLEHQGENLASMLTHNAGFNCVASRMIVQHRKWKRRGDLLDAVRASLHEAEQRHPYYPGARERWERFTAEHADPEFFGPVTEDGVPFTLLPDIHPDDDDHIAFTTEAFAGVMGEAAIDAPRSIPEYLERAVEFCNEQLWGNLAATIVVHPRSMKDPTIAAAVERAIEDLRYGVVIINHWSGGAGYSVVQMPWGAYPGNEMTDIQSGRGWVHNTFMIADEQIEKAVIRGPFKPDAKPPWFHSHRRLREVADKATTLEATGDLKRLPGLVWELLRG